MKKIKNIIYSICFLLVCNVGQAQNYKPLLDNFNEWHFTICDFGCLTDIYYTDGDTVVNNVSYRILDGFHYISRTFLIREDIPAK